MNKKYSFKEFLENPVTVNVHTGKTLVFDKVEIPIIQRDYAQGRTYLDQDKKNLNKTGLRFITSIFKHLKERQEMELDFVYGSVLEPDAATKRTDNVFLPLDGQQRLTTLFLLYWYIGIREIKEHEKRDSLMATLGKFSYVTRISSKDFISSLCNLSQSSMDFSRTDTPSQQIELLPWYYKSYKKDPTIASMLNMLDEIHSQYSKCSAEEKPLLPSLEMLRFYPFPLDGFNLTEDLYIKMNARGKQLTDFENFKADWINWMKDEKNPEVSSFSDIKEYQERKMPYYMVISQKLDNEWTDFFWSVSKDYDENERDPKTQKLVYPEGKLVDPLFMRFFRRFFHAERIKLASAEYKAAQLRQEEIEDDKIVNYFYGNKGQDYAISYSNNDFEEYFRPMLKYETITRMEKVLDTLCGNRELILDVLNPNWDKAGWSFYDRLINQRQRLAFRAVCSYAIQNGGIKDTEQFRDWMHMVWNSIADPNLRTIRAMIGAFLFIEDMAPNSADIVTYLSDQCDYSGRFKQQIQEEITKSKLFAKEGFKSVIRQAEGSRLFRGSIACLIKDKENTDLEVLKTRIAATEAIFEPVSFRDDPDDYTWIRAMLALKPEIGDIYSKAVDLSTSSTSDWRILINERFASHFTVLLDAVAGVPASDMPQKLEDICQQFTPAPGQEWLEPIIKWHSPDGHTLLGDYSVNRKIQAYDFYGKEKAQLYLYYKTDWRSSNNLLLTGFRNQLVRTIIQTTPARLEYPNVGIYNTFFTGRDVNLIRNVQIKGESFTFRYILTRDSLRVGLPDAEIFKDMFNRTVFIPNNQPNGEIAEHWVCRRKYDYASRISGQGDIDNLIAEIEHDVFDLSNPDSLLSKLNR